MQLLRRVILWYDLVAGGAFLVYTGLSLAIRRLWAWRARHTSTRRPLAA